VIKGITFALNTDPTTGWEIATAIKTIKETGKLALIGFENSQTWGEWAKCKATQTCKASLFGGLIGGGLFVVGAVASGPIGIGGLAIGGGLSLAGVHGIGASAVVGGLHSFGSAVSGAAPGALHAAAVGAGRAAASRTVINATTGSVG